MGNGQQNWLALLAKALSTPAASTPPPTMGSAPSDEELEERAAQTPSTPRRDMPKPGGSIASAFSSMLGLGPNWGRQAAVPAAAPAASGPAVAGPAGSRMQQGLDLYRQILGQVPEYRIPTGRTKADLISAFLSPAAAAFQNSMMSPRHSFWGSLVGGVVPSAIQYAELPRIRQGQQAQIEMERMKSAADILRALGPTMRGDTIRTRAGTSRGQPVERYRDQYTGIWKNPETGEPDYDFIETPYGQTPAGAGELARSRAIATLAPNVQRATETYKALSPLRIGEAVQKEEQLRAPRVETAKEKQAVLLPGELQKAKAQAGIVLGREESLAQFRKGLSEGTKSTKEERNKIVMQGEGQLFQSLM